MTAFGERIRSRREELKISLRAMADMLKVSGAYLSRVETGKDAVPTRDRIIELAGLLKLDKDELFALADKTDPDVEAYLKSTRGMPGFLRTAKDRDVTVEELEEALRRVLAKRGKDEKSSRHE